MNRRAVNIHARSNSDDDAHTKCKAERFSLGKTASGVASEPNAVRENLLFTGGIVALCLLVSLLTYSPTLCPLVYLGFAALCLPHRVVNFACRKLTFFLFDFCYFANLACCAFLLFRPEDRRLEASVYALCEGPLAAALIAWQCAWVLGSPDHVISVLIHLLPGLALYCHRYLAFSRQPSLLVTHIGRALLGNTDPWVEAARSTAAAATGGGGPHSASVAAPWSRRIAAAAAVSRGRGPCPTFTDAAATPSTAGKPLAGRHLVGMDPVPAWPSGGGIECYASTAGAPSSCPAPAWLWLGAAPLAFYLAWQLLYFLVVQVACRRMILAGGYDTSYRTLARRAQRANSPLNRLVRSGSVARRLLVYGLLQLLFTVVTQALAAVTYHNFAAATVWQVVKLVVPLYLGACHQCQRLPAQQLRAAAARLAAAGVLAAGPTQAAEAEAGEDGSRPVGKVVAVGRS